MPVNWPLTLRVLSVLCAIGVIITALFGFAATIVKDFPAGFIINMYLVLFSVMIIIGELRVRALMNRFQFLQTFLGRGIFYIFVGTICFMYPSIGNIVVGVVITANGAIHIFHFIIQSDAVKQEAQELREKGYVDTGLGKAVQSRVAKETKDQLKTQWLNKPHEEVP
eukprot:c4512_g1_i1.p1 GENE.c4512_g1_i1~~c4512_g1_i1.p1  ORF type:complete len:167 (+),score=10.38 c4512_g1_i1:31-531(+)